MKTHLCRLGACAALVTTLSLAAGAARAETEYFGQRGQFFLGGSSSFNAVQWQHVRGENNEPAQNNLAFDITPQFGVFVARNVLLGIDIKLGAVVPDKSPYQAVTSKDGITELGESPKNSFALGAIPRIGYNIDFGSGVSLLPSLGIGYQFQRQFANNSHQIEAEVRLPFVFQIARHGALLAGPSISYVSDGTKPQVLLPAVFTISAGGGLLIWL